MEYGNYEEVLQSDCLQLNDANIQSINQYNGTLMQPALQPSQHQQQNIHFIQHTQPPHQHQQQQSQRFNNRPGERQIYIPGAQRNPQH